MLKPKKKLTRKELHKDPLMEKLTAISDYTQSNSKMISYTIAGTLILAVIVYGYINNRNTANAESMNKLFTAEQVYFGGNYVEAIRKLEKFCKLHEGTKGAALGEFYLANSYYNTNQFEFAIKHFEIYLDDYAHIKELTVTSIAGIAASHEGLDNYKEAVKYYQQAVEDYPDFYLRPDYMLALARCHKELGELQQAHNWFEQVIENYPDSKFARTAKKERDLLGPLG